MELPLTSHEIIRIGVYHSTDPLELSEQTTWFKGCSVTGTCSRPLNVPQ